MRDVCRITTEIAAPVERRLRMLALIERQPLSQVLSLILDRHLPPAEELAGLLLADKAAS